MTHTYNSLQITKKNHLPTSIKYLIFLATDKQSTYIRYLESFMRSNSSVAIVPMARVVLSIRYGVRIPRL